MESYNTKVLVKDFLGDLLFLLEEKSSTSEYWQKCLDFVYDNQNRLVMFLSEKQVNWLFKIKEGLLEESKYDRV